MGELATDQGPVIAALLHEFSSLFIYFLSAMHHKKISSGKSLKICSRSMYFNNDFLVFPEVCGLSALVSFIQLKRNKNTRKYAMSTMTIV